MIAKKLSITCEESEMKLVYGLLCLLTAALVWKTALLSSKKFSNSKWMGDYWVLSTLIPIFIALLVFGIAEIIHYTIQNHSPTWSEFVLLMAILLISTTLYKVVKFIQMNKKNEGKRPPSPGSSGISGGSTHPGAA